MCVCFEIQGLPSDNLTAPTTTGASTDASVWLYNNLQKSPNQYSYQSNDLNSIRGDNLRDGNGYAQFDRITV